MTTATVEIIFANKSHLTVDTFRDYLLNDCNVENTSVTNIQQNFNVITEHILLNVTWTKEYTTSLFETKFRYMLDGWECYKSDCPVDLSYDRCDCSNGVESVKYNGEPLYNWMSQ